MLQSIEHILQETQIPDKYELKASELYQLYDQIGIKDLQNPEEAFTKTILPIYKIAFARGQEYERKRKKSGKG